MRALAQLVAHRRRLVGDHPRLTNRLTSPLKHDFPQALQGFHDKETAICCDFLTPWPTLKAVQLARRSPLERFFRDHHVRDAEVITQRLDAIQSATPLTTDAGIITPNALVVQALVAQLRVTWPAMEDFDKAMAHRAQRHPDFPPFVAWAAASTRHSFWAHAYDQQQRDTGASHQAAVRALAFKGIRLLCRCWQPRTRHEEAIALNALKRRGAPRLHSLAQGS